MEVTCDKIIELRQNSLPLLSLDAEVGEYSEVTLGDLIEDTTEDDLDEKDIETRIRKALDGVLANLSKRQRQVIVRRFGLDRHPQTLEDIGNEFHITRERVRQIEVQALKRLRHPSRTRQLIGFLPML